MRISVRGTMPNLPLAADKLATRTTTVVTALLVWLAMATTASSVCPSTCVCRWKGGKDTTECVDNGLGGIPPGIDTGTQVLDMTGNNLQVLPKEIFLRNGLTNLQRIYLVNCKLSQIDKQALSRLNNLVELDLSNNLLSNIPSESFVGIPDLRRLVLSGNPIRRIESKAFAHLGSLIALELSNCQVDSVGEDAFQGLPNLQQLKLNGNQLRMLSIDVLKDIRSLHGIRLEENPWTCNCHSRDLRQWLVASNVPYSIAPQCSEPARLRGFNLDKLIVDDFACIPFGNGPYQVVQVQQGANVSLECKVYADPEAYIHWIWQDNVITNTTGTITAMANEYADGRTYFVEESGSKEKMSVLTLEAVDERDVGQYICVAENRGGRFLVNFTLEVDSVPVKQLAPVVVNKGFLLGVIIGLGVFALSVLVLVCVLILRFCHSQRRRRRHRQKIPRSDTQDTKGSSTYDSQSDPLNDKRDLQPANPIQKPPRSFANTTYVSTSEISLHDYVQSGDRTGDLEGPAPLNGIYSIKPDIIKMDTDTGEYSVPRGGLTTQLANGAAEGNIYQNTGRWSNESPIATCHGCGDHAGSCLGVPCLHAYGNAEVDAESDRSYRTNFRPTASGLAGEEYDVEEWPRPPPPLYDTVKPPVAVDVWHPHSDYETVEYPVATGQVWERQSPSVAGAGAADNCPGGSALAPGVSKNPNVHLKNNSVSGLSPFPILNLSTVRDSPDEGYEDEGEEGTEV